MKNGIFIGTRQNPDDILEVANDIAKRLNETNNINFIAPTSEGVIEIPTKDKIFIQIGGGKSTSGNYIDVLLFYGEEEETIQSFNFDSYDDFINQVVSQVNDILNNQIKVVTYSQRHKCYGRKWMFLKGNSQWEIYQSFEFNGFFIRLFVRKDKYKENIYDFRL